VPDKTKLEPEFGSYSAWIVEEAETLDVRDRIAVASRGTGNPALLDAAAEAAGIAPGDLVLDAGSGLGGPAEWLATRYRCSVVGFDLMEASVAGHHRLFSGARSLVAASDRLPFPDETFDAAWSLGVLEMIEGKQEALGEIARVMRRGARFSLYDFASENGVREDGFIERDTMVDLLRGSGLEIIELVPAQVAESPPRWRDVTKRVREGIARRHAGDPRLERAEADRRRFLGLRSEGRIRDWIIVAGKAL
jgi:SAM-dependent methyltransferase